MPKPRKPKLSIRDQKFVELVAQGNSASEAFIKAGHKRSKNARIAASRKLTNSNIQGALEERKAYYRAIADIQAKEVVGAYTEMAFASIEDALDDEGRLDFVKAKQNGSVKLIRKISRQQTKFGENVLVEFYPRTDALSNLSDILGLKQLPGKNLRDEVEIAKAVATALVEQGWSESDAYAYAQKRYATPLLLSDGVN